MPGKTCFKILAHFSLSKITLKRELKFLFNELNLQDNKNLFNGLRLSSSLENLFSDIGPFGTFEKFMAFMENLSKTDLLVMDIERFADLIEFQIPNISSQQIDDLVCQIEFIPAISLTEHFVQILPMKHGGSIHSSVVYCNINYTYWSMIVSAFNNNGVKLERSNHLILVFPKGWGKKYFSRFISELISIIGLSEIPYSGEPFKKKEENSVQASVFELLMWYFCLYRTIVIRDLISQSFFNMIGIEQPPIKIFGKKLFMLLLKFLFVIDNCVATSHPNFDNHLPHFVVAFMKLIDAPMEETIKSRLRSGPHWVNSIDPKVIVCSSFATKKNCCKKTCKFLHPTNLKAEYGIITFADGNLMVVCTPCTDIKCSFNRDMNKKYTCECGFAFSCKCKSASECICDCCMKPNCAKSDYIPLCPFAHFDKTIDDFVYREQVVDGGCCAELQPRNGK